MVRIYYTCIRVSPPNILCAPLEDQIKVIQPYSASALTTQKQATTANNFEAGESSDSEATSGVISAAEDALDEEQVKSKKDTKATVEKFRRSVRIFPLLLFNLLIPRCFFKDRHLVRPFW